MEHAEHFETLTIRRFRGLVALDLDGIGTLNVLVGANDVGKTSVLEALFLLSNVANMHLPVLIQNWRSYMVGDFDGLSPLFHQVDVDAPVELTASSAQEHRTLTISAPYEQTIIDTEGQSAAANANGKAIEHGKAGGAGSQSSSALFGPRALKYDATVRQAPHDDSILFTATLVDRGEKWEVIREPGSAPDTTIPAGFHSARLGYDADTIGDVIVGKKTAALLSYLRVVNPQVEEVAVRGTAAYLDIGSPRMIPLNMFGSGMVRAAAILAAAIARDQRILLIDEIEYGLHYSAIPPLLRALLSLSAERGMQVFITTHSLDTLRGLQKVLSEAPFSKHQPTTCCYALERDVHGSVRPYRYDYDQFEHCVISGLEIR